MTTLTGNRFLHGFVSDVHGSAQSHKPAGAEPPKKAEPDYRTFNHHVYEPNKHDTPISERVSY
jgi:hypothetical protein